MQLTELSVIGLRSAVIDLESRKSPLRFRLFPMIHMGVPAFYRQVTERLGNCGIIVAEGWDRPSSTGAAYALATRLTRQYGAGDLVAQNIDYASFQVPVVWPDGHPCGDHRQGLGALGWLDLVWFTPILTVSMLVGGRDWLLRQRLDINDNTEVRLRLFHTLLLEQRDTQLLEALEAILDRHSRDSLTVAVVYGAAHMPAVVHCLRERHGYHTRNGEWLSVIDFSSNW
jgi:hypothetical protein